MIREPIVIAHFNLNEIENVAMFPVPRGIGCRVTLEPIDWVSVGPNSISPAALTVRYVVGASEVDFASAKALNNGTRSVQISEAGLVGADQIAVRVSTVASGSGRVLCNLALTVDQSEPVRQ